MHFSGYPELYIHAPSVLAYFSHNLGTMYFSVNPPPHHTTTVLRPFFRDHPGESVPEENFWTLLCKGRLIKANTPTIRLGATPSGPTSAHLHHPSRRLRLGEEKKERKKKKDRRNHMAKI